MYRVQSITSEALTLLKPDGYTLSVPPGTYFGTSYIWPVIERCVRDGVLEVRRLGKSMHWGREELQVLEEVAIMLMDIPDRDRLLHTGARFQTLRYHDWPIMLHPALTGRSAVSVRIKLRLMLNELLANQSLAGVRERLAPPIPAAVGQDGPTAEVLVGERRIEDGVVVIPGVQWNDW
jgi:hypothetical protein